MAEMDLGDVALTPDERRGSDRKKLIIDVRFDGGDGTGIEYARHRCGRALYDDDGAARHGHADNDDDQRRRTNAKPQGRCRLFRPGPWRRREIQGPRCRR